MIAVGVEGLGVRADGRDLLRGVDLEVPGGTWCTVIGPNGAGKTTLVRAVAGLRRPSAGRVALSGADVAAMGERERARRVALVVQHPEVPDGMSVRDYVGLGRTAHHGLLRGGGPSDAAVVTEVLERLALGDLAARDVATLSGGERQRTVLARALAQATPLIVLDEPTTGLDLRHQVELLELLRAEVAAGLTVVATLHDLTLAGQFADRLVLLDRGEVATEGPPGEVVRSPALAAAYGMDLRVVDVDGVDVVVPSRAARGGPTGPVS